MLVLTRKQSETIQIGDSITITVLRMKGKAVRLGIKAPHDFNVIRGELAFDLADVQPNVANESDKSTAEIQQPAKSKSRIRGNSQVRQGDSWSTKPELPVASATSSVAATWSI